MYPTLLCTVVFYMSRITLRDYTDMSKVLGLDLHRLTNSTQPAFLDFSKPQSWKLDSIFHVYYKYIQSYHPDTHDFVGVTEGKYWHETKSLPCLDTIKLLEERKLSFPILLVIKSFLPSGSSNGQTKIDCRTFQHGVIAWLCNNIGL